MNIEQRYKKTLCLFILAISLLLCLGTFYNRQIAHAATSQGDTVDQLDTADQKTSTFTFKKKMSFSVLKTAVANGDIDKENQVPITAYIGDTKQDSPKTMKAGVINETTMPTIPGARFVGAYVEFPDGTETQIYYTGRYTETDEQNKETSYIYYAYSPTPETGVLLEGKAYIKLEYEATYDLSYRVEDEQGNKLSDGLQEEDTGGYFVTPTTKLTQGTQLNIHFIPQRKASERGNDYELKKLYIQKNDKEKTKTAIAFDDDDAAKADISGNSTVVAVVSPVTKYRMHVVNPFSDHHGYICWKGYGGNYNPNTNTFDNVEDNGSLTDIKGTPIHAMPAIDDDPKDKAIIIGTVKDAQGNVHGVRYLNDLKYKDVADPDFLYENQNQFCSCTKQELDDENGHVVNKAGNIATTTAAPGGTFYFVMYSQCGTNWQFSRLSINGVALDAIYDGQVHDTKLKNGMVAHFKFDRYEDYKDDKYVNYDPHLEKDRQNSDSIFKSNKRLKFECWVSNASSDINVDFSCDAKDNESLTLTKAQGIQRIVASSYDEDHDGNLWWDSLYNGKPYWRKKGSLDWTWTEYNKDGQLSPNNVYNASDTLPHELFNETDGLDPWTKDKTPAFSTATNSYHTKMEDRSNYEGLYRYLYYDTLPGYDERTTKVHITGASDQSSQDVNYGSITLVPQSYHTKDTNNSSNKALSQAIREGYTNYIQYYSKHMRHRNIQITTDPYKYKAIYDLDGGTLNDQDKYTDSQEYTIEEGSNHILMPTATPVRKGYVFAGWQCTSINIDPQFKDYKSKPRMPNEKYEINATTYDYGLDTEEQKITYSYYDPNKKTEVTVPERKFYVDKKDANNRFEFKALWVDRHNLPAGKDVYTIKINKQVSQKDYKALSDDQKTTKNGKYYKIFSSNDYLGTIGKTIIGIPPQADAGYTFNKDESIIKLKNFMQTKESPEPSTLQYYYDFDGSQNLTIKHITSGNMGDQNQLFDITVTLKDNGALFTGEKDVEGTNATIWGGAQTTGASATGKLKFDNGKATIHLRGNQQLIIKNVGIGSYDVSETSSTLSTLYTTQYQIDQQDKTDTAISDASIVKNGNPIVTIYNVRDIPETGINMPKNHPGQMMAFIITGCGAFYFVYKRNERRIRRMILVAIQKMEDFTQVHHK